MKKENGSDVRFYISLVDVIILLFVLLCMIGLFIRTEKLGAFFEKEPLGEYRIRFAVSDIAATSIDAFVTGDTFTLVSYHEVLGTLVEVESVSPAVVYVESEQHEIIRTQYPEETRVDVIGVLDAKGSMGESGFSLGGSIGISPGIEYRIQSEHVDVVLKIIDIEQK